MEIILRKSSIEKCRRMVLSKKKENEKGDGLNVEVERGFLNSCL